VLVKKSFAYLVANLLALPLFCSSVLAGSLEYWKFDLQDSRLDIITDDNVRPQVQLLANPTRLVIDLPGIYHRGPTLEKAISSYVKMVRVGQVNRATTRIVVELNEAYSMRPWEVEVRGLAPNRWATQLPKFLMMSEYTPPTESVAIAVPEPAPRPIKQFTVIIDPGHGGQDPGAIGLRGQQEKDIVLSISLAVAKELEKQGIGVVLTRANDTFISLKGRVARAEAVNATIFVSIHANSMGMGRAEINGLETYHYSSGYGLAKSIHRSVLRRIDIADRRIRRARFYVLRKSSMPSTLVEVGFVTGEKDNRNLANPRYRQRMAEAIAAGIIDYLR